MSFVLIDIAKIRKISAYSKYLGVIFPELLRQGGNETTKAVYESHGVSGTWPANDQNLSG